MPDPFDEPRFDDDIRPPRGRYVNARPQLLDSQWAQLSVLASTKRKPLNVAGDITRQLSLERARTNRDPGNARYGRGLGVAEKLAAFDGLGGLGHIDASKRRKKLRSMKRIDRTGTMGDILTQVARRQVDGQETQASAGGEGRRSNRLRVTARGIVASASGLPTVDLLQIVSTELLVDQWERKGESERNQRILAVGRRGALATRPLQSVGLTNRTGAAASLGSQPASASAGSRNRLGTAAKGTGSRQLQSGKSAVVSASTDAAARSAMASSPQMPSASSSSSSSSSRSASSSAQRTAQRLLSSLGSPVRTASGQRRAVTLGGLPGVKSGGVNPSTPSQSLPSLAGLSQGMASPPPRDKCKCPPKRKPKSDTPRCSNPLLSRTEKDGILTIKRSLKCPPSKPKRL